MMDLGFFHGLWSLLILILFIGIVFFVWHRKRRDYYEQASRIPFDHDDELRHIRSQKRDESNEHND